MNMNIQFCPLLLNLHKSYFNGCNIQLRTLDFFSRHGYFKSLMVNQSARLGGNGDNLGLSFRMYPLESSRCSDSNKNIQRTFSGKTDKTSQKYPLTFNFIARSKEFLETKKNKTKQKNKQTKKTKNKTRKIYLLYPIIGFEEAYHGQIHAIKGRNNLMPYD